MFGQKINHRARRRQFVSRFSIEWQGQLVARSQIRRKHGALSQTRPDCNQAAPSCFAHNHHHHQFRTPLPGPDGTPPKINLGGPASPALRHVCCCRAGGRTLLLSAIDWRGVLGEGPALTLRMIERVLWPARGEPFELICFNSVLSVRKLGSTTTPPTWTSNRLGGLTWTERGRERAPVAWPKLESWLDRSTRISRLSGLESNAPALF